jgi:hypothetical protein
MEGYRRTKAGISVGRALSLGDFRPARAEHVVPIHCSGAFDRGVDPKGYARNDRHPRPQRVACSGSIRVALRAE